MKFSERKGLTPIREILQINNIDKITHNRLWNVLTLTYWNIIKRVGYQREDIQIFFYELWDQFFNLSVDTISKYWEESRQHIRDFFFKCEWFRVYDFLEFSYNNFPNYYNINSSFEKRLNKVLTEELCAYRLIGDKIAEITSETEISEIEEAFKSPNPIKIHLKSALDKLADRKEPDYRNSIKESISAVETICRMITGDSKATLGQALKIIENKINIHPALKTAFDKLYGYTSDEDGIRHCLMDESNLDFEDAKFMLVSCSAFINYLKEKASKVKIEL